MVKNSLPMLLVALIKDTTSSYKFWLAYLLRPSQPQQWY